MSKLQTKPETNGYFILPHHFVKKESCVTTSKTDTCYSMNDLQFVEPTI